MRTQRVHFLILPDLAVSSYCLPYNHWDFSGIWQSLAVSQSGYDCGGNLALKLLIILVLRTNIEPSSYVVTNTIIVTPGTIVSGCLAVTSKPSSCSVIKINLPNTEAIKVFYSLWIGAIAVIPPASIVVDVQLTGCVSHHHYGNEMFTMAGTGLPPKISSCVCDSQLTRLQFFHPSHWSYSPPARHWYSWIHYRHYKQNVRAVTLPLRRNVLVYQPLEQQDKVHLRKNKFELAEIREMKHCSGK